MNKRLHELDSLRGLASLTVVLSHFMLVYDFNFQDTQMLGLKANWFKHTPLHLFWAGGEAVILFFVLSGFVLFLPFTKLHTFSYKEYIIKRLFRIYPASIVAVLVALSLYFVQLENSRVIDSLWINSMWDKDISTFNVFSDLLLIGYGGSGLNPVLWSLIHEIRLSLVFPIIAYLVSKFDWKKVIIGAGSVSFAGFVAANIFGLHNTSIIVTLAYSIVFVVGALLAKYRTSILEKVKDMKWGFKLIFLFVGLLFYTAGWIIDGQSFMHNNFTLAWATTIGSSVFIIISLASARISGILESKFIQFFGRISYSVYLYHMIFLLFFLKIGWTLSVPVSLFLTFLASVAVATLSYNYIELPAISAGSKLVKILGTNINQANTIVK